MDNTEDSTYYATMYALHGSTRKAAAACGIPETTFRGRLKKERQNNKIAKALNPLDKCRKTGKSVYVITAAQNNTSIHVAFWENLKTYAACRGAEIIVVPITYTPHGLSHEDKVWDERVREYLVNERVKLHERLHLCGEMDITPTAVRPLSGLDSYTGDAWAIFPHSKIALVSVATPKGEPAKMNMTTGCCTVPHYIPKKTGLKAVFHHSYGAVVVEIDHDAGLFWTRHISAMPDGSFFDLGYNVTNGEVSTTWPVAALVMGDIHIEKVDTEALSASLEIAKALSPKEIITHDVIDFAARNHHNRKSFSHKFRTHVRNEESVAKAFEKAVDFLTELSKHTKRVIVVPSNHHDAFRRWLEETNFKDDPINAEFYLREMLRYVEKMNENAEVDFDPFVLTMEAYLEGGPDIEFLDYDESHVIHGIEIGNHGHLGPNGARGTPAAFSKMSKKTITAHTHSASIHDGCYTVGTTSKLDMGYNRGPSSWSHTNAIIYANGHRALLTMAGGRYYMDDVG